ncbi:hypothetical protein [Pendulispora albinea]|uniref:Uncharacterized protein n=1 Tax=Pendulispora albinea TaxID=2741071 RepID=A0ABZ2LTB6_9BACT
MDVSIQVLGEPHIAIPALGPLRRLVAAIPGARLAESGASQSPPSKDHLSGIDPTVVTAVLAAPAVLELVKVLRVWVEGLNEQKRRALKVKIDGLEFEVSNVGEETLAQLGKKLLERAKK